jgi:hypothetical protein
MIALTSNLDAVIRNAQRRFQAIPRAMSAALEPREWKAFALSAARNTLEALAPINTDRKFVEQFISSAYVTLIGGKLVMGMSAPNSRLALVAAQLNIPGLAPETFAELNVADVDAEAQLEQAIMDWVADEKRWDPARDGEKNFENIHDKATWILGLLLAPPGMLSTTAVQPGDMSESEARENLLPPILEFIAQRTKENSAGPNLDPATARLWLNAVLATWSALVRTGYREHVRAHLKN